MSDNLKAAAFAAGLSPEEQKRINSFNKALTVHRELTNLPQDVAQAKYGKYTPEQQNNLQKNFGNQDPTVEPKRGLLDNALYYTVGKAGEALGYVGGKILAGLGNASDLSTRLYRTGAIALDQGVPLVGAGNAWDIANDKGDKVFSPGRILNAKVKWGETAVSIAQRIASGEDPEVIMATATPEEKKYVMLADPTNKVIPGLDGKNLEAARANFQDTLDDVQAAKYSPGRQVANAILPGEIEGSGFFYKAISGSVDAAYRILADPLLLAGKAKRAIDVSKYALDVVVGGGKVDQYFANPKAQTFWNQYGAELSNLAKAQKENNPAAMLAAREELSKLAPELGPAVIKSFLEPKVPVSDAKTAQAFFENTKQLDTMLTGGVGRQRVILPIMDTSRKLRIAAVTTGRKVRDLDIMGPRLVDDTWYGGATTSDGIMETVINGQKVIVDQVKANSNFKGIARFSTKYIQHRIDRAKAKFVLVPGFTDEAFDVTAKDAPETMYRLASMIMPTREAKMFSAAFENIAEVGKKKDAYYGLWSTIAELRGMNTTQPGQQIVRYLTGKTQAVFGLDDAFPDKGALPSDFNNLVAAPSLKDLDRAASRNGLFQNMIGLANSDLASRMTSAWSFLTLAGPRYALRNAGEDLMVNLAIGQSPWGLAKSRVLSTRINTYMQAVKKVEGNAEWADNPLGIVMRMVNKKDVDRYTAELTTLGKKFDDGKLAIAELNSTIKKLPEGSPEIAIKQRELAALQKELAGGITEQSRQIFARALTEGGLNRTRKALGMKPMNTEEIDILTEQIKYGDIENALSVASEGGLNYVTGNDYITRATNLARQTGVRVHALEISPSKETYVKKPGERGFKVQAVTAQDTASLHAWMMSIGKYANDDLGKIAVANLDDPNVLDKMLAWTETKAGQKFLADARLQNNMDARSIIKIAYDRTRNNFAKRNGDINLDLLNKVRVKNKYGEYEVSGTLSLDDLPTNVDDMPNAIIGPTLIPAVDLDQVTSSVMTKGWTFLGLANARMSRQPIVLEEMIKLRKQMKKSGFEDAWIKAHIRGIDPENVDGIAIATERAKVAYATVVEERAMNQVLQYVDNPLVRTQLAFSSRNFARFYRATEDFYRRMYRVVKYNPEAIAKAALTYEGVTHSGWIQQDDQGESYFVYPAIGPVYNAVQNTLDRLGIGNEFKVPFPVEFGAKVKMLTPSLNPDSLVPTFSGPISGVGFTVVTQLISGLGAPGAADTIKGYALGKYAVDQPIVSAFLPAHVNRFVQAMDQDDRNSQYASAWRKAVTYLEASGHGLPKKYDEEGNLLPPTPGEQEAYRLAIKNTTLNILGMRFVFGFFAPASPAVQLKSDMAQWISDNGRSNFKQSFNNLLDQYPGDYDAAMAKWVELFPNQIAFTITESERKSIAPLRYAEEAGNFVDQHKELFRDYSSAAAFLIPHKSGFSWDAYKNMKDLGLIQNKRVDDYLREVQTAADLQQYYTRKDIYEESLTEATVDFERTELRKEFDEWKAVFFAGRPLVQEELSQGSQKAIDRLRTLDELNVMLSKNLDIRPKTEAKLREMSDAYQAYRDERDNYDEFGGNQQIVKMLKEDTIIKLRELAAYNENTQAAYDVLFGRLLGD
jgi:hypothetical protein